MSEQTKAQLLAQLRRSGRALDRYRERRKTAVSKLAEIDEAIRTYTAQRDARVLAGRERSDITYKDMAEVLGMSEDGVWKIIDRAKRSGEAA